jgi:putative transposase
MVDKGEGIQATICTNPSSVQKKSQPSLNRQLDLLGISKTAYYYKPIDPFSTNKDKKLLDVIDKSRILKNLHPELTCQCQSKFTR